MSPLPLILMKIGGTMFSERRDEATLLDLRNNSPLALMLRFRLIPDEEV